MRSGKRKSVTAVPSRKNSGLEATSKVSGSAPQAPATKPTYPEPTTAMRVGMYSSENGSLGRVGWECEWHAPDCWHFKLGIEFVYSQTHGFPRLYSILGLRLPMSLNCRKDLKPRESGLIMASRGSLNRGQYESSSQLAAGSREKTFRRRAAFGGC